MGMKSRSVPKPKSEPIDTTDMVDESNVGGFETECPSRIGGQHCLCWYGNEPCCACGDNDEGLDA